jgi:hypothetical protein
MCWTCWVASHTYEYVCAHCGQVQQATGANASQRRYLDAHGGERSDGPRKNFCDRICANRHHRRLYSTLRQLSRTVDPTRP